jgi:hypothetical protein
MAAEDIFPNGILRGLRSAPSNRAIVESEKIWKYSSWITDLTVSSEVIVDATIRNQLLMIQVGSEGNHANSRRLDLRFTLIFFIPIFSLMLCR